MYYSLLSLVLLAILSNQPASDPAYADQIKQWQATREKKLRADNGWLTLAGRYPLKQGPNTFGTGKENDIVLPPQLAGTGPSRLGTLHNDPYSPNILLKLADGVTMTSEGKPFTGVRTMGTVPGKRDWVSLGRISLHVIQHQGRFVLRLADNESLVRKTFPGCRWYPANEKYKVQAKFIPYSAGKMISMVNVLDEVSLQPCPGYLEFELDGATHRLDTIQEGAGLFIVFSDQTAGETTYSAARFIDIDKQPQDNATLTFDFNHAYNPPCAFSEFTTCPRAPKQNVLKVRIEAGEQYRGKK